MGTGVLQFPIAPPNRCFHEFFYRRNNNSSTNIASTSTSSWCCFWTRNGGRTGGSDWDGSSFRSSRERNKYQDEFFSFDYEDDRQDYGFRNSGKRRTWWSDDSLSWDEDDDDGEEKIGGFGVLEGAIGFSSIFKVFRAFGWMVPAVIVSMLIGNDTIDTSGFVMALVVPLAQSALSLIFDAVWGRSSNRGRPHSRKKSAFAGRGGVNKKTRKDRKQNSQSDKKIDGYQSWEAANNFTAKKKERMTQSSFGGWDELDKR